MNHRHSAAVFRLRAVHDIVFPALGGKTEGGIGDAAHIVRMGRAVHIVIHDIIGLCPVLETEQVQKALRQDERNHPPVYELIDRQRNRCVFQAAPDGWVKLILSHKA